MPIDGIYGMDRVSRHSNLWSMAFISLGFALRSIYLTEIIMFSFPMIFALIGGSHQDYRYRRNEGGYLPKE